MAAIIVTILFPTVTVVAFYLLKRWGFIVRPGS